MVVFGGREGGIHSSGRLFGTNSFQIFKEYSSLGDESIPTFFNQTLQKIGWNGSIPTDSSKQTLPNELPPSQKRSF